MAATRFPVVLALAAAAGLSAGLHCGDAETCVEEVCNGLDDNCDGRTDESMFQDCSTPCGTGRRQCVGGDWSVCSAPGTEPETCNGIDDDCDGQTDDGVLRQFYRDGDGDTYGGEDTAREGCSPQPGELASGNDCADDDPAIHPGVAETCDGIDEDCSGTPDEGCECITDTTQACGDWTEEGPCELGSQTCTAGRWSTCTGGVRPADETCNALDDDCDTTADEGMPPDAHEANETCEAATELTGLDEVDSREPLHELAGGGSLVHADGSADVDWYVVQTTEDSAACVPFMSECCYRFAVEFAPPAGLPRTDFRLCLFDQGDCASLGSGTCAEESHWNPTTGMYAMTLCWSGSCGSEDGRTIHIRVDAIGSASPGCASYQLRYNFYLIDDDCT